MVAHYQVRCSAWPPGDGVAQRRRRHDDHGNGAPVRRLCELTAGIVLAVALNAAAHAEGAPTAIKGATTVNADAVIELILKTDNLVVLDNRVVADYEAGHLEGAIRLIDTDITSEAVLAKHVRSKDTPVLFYCNGLKCGRAAIAATKAIEWGYTKVYYYAFGLEEWRKRALPLVR
jgi:rhodanese-related sulfurtransferase